MPVAIAIATKRGYEDNNSKASFLFVLIADNIVSEVVVNPKSLMLRISRNCKKTNGVISMKNVRAFRIHRASITYEKDNDIKMRDLAGEAVMESIPEKTR